MKRYFLSILTFAITSLIASGQYSTAYIKENAISIDTIDSLDSDIFKLISGYQLIMVGEMHGTVESAKFTIGLLRLLTLFGDSVQVGLEIAPELMNAFNNHPSDSNIYASNFFAAKGFIDGRETYSWAEIISETIKNPNAKIFFFDGNASDYKISDNRDSIMYSKIKRRMREHPHWKTITLSGNIHNLLLPFQGEKKAGYYLRDDKSLSISRKICSLNHRYSKGTTLNNYGDGLKIHEEDDSASNYCKAVDYNNYFLLFSSDTVDQYSGIYFTRKVTAAKMINNK